MRRTRCHTPIKSSRKGALGWRKTFARRVAPDVALGGVSSAWGEQNGPGAKN